MALAVDDAELVGQTRIMARGDALVELEDAAQELGRFIASPADVEPRLERPAGGGKFLLIPQQPVVAHHHRRCGGDIGLEQLRCGEECIEREQSAQGGPGQDTVRGVGPVLALDKGDDLALDRA